MKGSLFHELEVGLPASEVWEVYGTLRLAQLVVELLPHVIQKVDVIEGDGGVGTVLKVTFAPGTPGVQFYKEKFVKVDNEKRVKEVLVVEGGFLDLGFRSVLFRLENIEKDSNSSFIKSTIEYEIDEEHAANASLVTTAFLATMAETISKYLTEKKTGVMNS
ncbi:norbelladine synthase [Elaeis guineensis]|uniref:S-norcoclaurine synthase 2 n=1 Tax=Elaeis guineensis var. tenera TaxID=51953 RepID=A0A6I9QFW5_ELAGV|nr:S-norcoclaurine synthase 2 [Elaeis guineensis]